MRTVYRLNLTTLRQNGSSNGRGGMRPKKGRAEQIFKDYTTTGGNRGRDSVKNLLDTIDGLNG